MKNRNTYTIWGAAVGMLVLILDGQTAFSGAKDGLQICLQTVIPSLFPFFVLSILMTGALGGQTLKLLRPIGKLCKIPPGCEALLAIGFLGGYPSGAQSVALAWKRNQISKQDAQRMIAFCSNAGPAFLFGMIGPMFSDFKAPWLLWLIHIFSALMVGALLPGADHTPTRPCRQDPITLSDALKKAIEVTASVCGWVVLFRMIIAFGERWILWAVPAPFQVLITGILELSNGCIRLENLEHEGLRFVMASALLALGGVCVTMQTASVTKGLSLKAYFPGKILQAGISFVTACALQPLTSMQQWTCPSLLAVFAAVGCIFLTIILRRTKNRSSIPAHFGV